MKTTKISRKYIYDFYLLAAIIMFSVIWIFASRIVNKHADTILIKYENQGKKDQYSVVINPKQEEYYVFYHNKNNDSYAISQSFILLNDALDFCSVYDEYNIIFVNKNSVSIIEANCPDKTCVHTKAATHDNDSIICLPHKLIIVLESTTDGGELDAISG